MQPIILEILLKYLRLSLSLVLLFIARFKGNVKIIDEPVERFPPCLFFLSCSAPEIENTMSFIRPNSIFSKKEETIH